MKFSEKEERRAKFHAKKAQADIFMRTYKKNTKAGGKLWHKVEFSGII